MGPQGSIVVSHWIGFQGIRFLRIGSLGYTSLGIIIKTRNSRNSAATGNITIAFHGNMGYFYLLFSLTESVTGNIDTLVESPITLEKDMYP
jgi:hypothetical protein